MKILVLNGSPKGNSLSVSNLHVDYLKKHFPMHTFNTVAVAKKIKKIAADADLRQSIVTQMTGADMIIWAFPVYLYMVPAQIKQFVELLYQHLPEGALYNKYCIAISTSIKVYDAAAHEYIHAICEDFGMIYLAGFPFEATIRKDLLDVTIRRGFIEGFAHVLDLIEQRKLPAIHYSRKRWFEHNFIPVYPAIPTIKQGSRKIVIVSDGRGGSNLDKMIQLFCKSTTLQCEVINLNHIRMKSGCIGCLRCQYRKQCAIDDDINDIYLNKLRYADCILLAGTVCDQHFSSTFKEFIDRGFFIAQQPEKQTKRKYIAYLVSGPVRQRPMAKQFLDIYAASRYCINMGYVSDEYTNNQYLSDLIINHAHTVDRYVTRQIAQPLAGYSRMYHLMIREMLAVLTSIKTLPYRHYRQNGLFDFPILNPSLRLQGAFYNILFNTPVLRKRARKNVLRLHHRMFSKLFDE